MTEIPLTQTLRKKIPLTEPPNPADRDPTYGKCARYASYLNALVHLYLFLSRLTKDVQKHVIQMILNEGGTCPCSCPCGLTYFGNFDVTRRYVCRNCPPLPPPPPPPRRRGCFPSFAKVNLEIGNSIALSELRVGDRVKTGLNTDFLVYFGYLKAVLQSMTY